MLFFLLMLAVADDDGGVCTLDEGLNETVNGRATSREYTSEERQPTVGAFWANRSSSGNRSGKGTPRVCNSLFSHSERLAPFIIWRASSSHQFFSGGDRLIFSRGTAASECHPKLNAQHSREDQGHGRQWTRAHHKDPLGPNCIGAHFSWKNKTLDSKFKAPEQSEIEDAGHKWKIVLIESDFNITIKIVADDYTFGVCCWRVDIGVILIICLVFFFCGDEIFGNIPSSVAHYRLQLYIAALWRPTG